MCLLAGVLVLVCPSPASASCTVSSASVSFGTYDVFAPPPTDSTGSVEIRCSLVVLSISVELSTGGATTFQGRRMVRSGERLFYNLFQDAARTVIWGDGSAGTSRQVVNTLLNGHVQLPIYARVPAGQDVSAGSYADTLTVTVNF